MTKPVISQTAEQTEDPTLTQVYIQHNPQIDDGPEGFIEVHEGDEKNRDFAMFEYLRKREMYEILIGEVEKEKEVLTNLYRELQEQNVKLDYAKFLGSLIYDAILSSAHADSIEKVSISCIPVRDMITTFEFTIKK